MCIFLSDSLKRNGSGLSVGRGDGNHEGPVMLGENLHTTLGNSGERNELRQEVPSSNCDPIIYWR